MRILLVDDEALARARLRVLLADLGDAALLVAAEAEDAEQALACLRAQAVDLVLLDVHMPGRDGLSLAQLLARLPAPPAVVFVTAHAQHALAAFEIEAVDYLTKPVRLERLRQALSKVKRQQIVVQAAVADASQDVLLIRERGRVERVPLGAVLYLRSDLKYLTVHTAQASHLIEGSLSEFEQRRGADFLRVHRSVLVARHSLRALERTQDADGSEAWTLRLHGVDEALPVSRRQLGAVREALAAG